MSIMVLQDFKSSPQNSRPLESGHRRHGVWVAIEYSYKMSQKMIYILVRTRLVFAETVTYSISYQLIGKKITRFFWSLKYLIEHAVASIQ